MKFYATVTTRRVIEIEATDLEQAIGAADRQVSALLPERELWKPQIEVSAVQGQGENRYYVMPVTVSGQPILFQVRERQLQYQAGPDNPGIHPSDLVIRPFGTDQESARYYAQSMSDLQRKLDKLHGRWVRHAITPEITGERGVV